MLGAGCREGGTLRGARAPRGPRLFPVTPEACPMSQRIFTAIAKGNGNSFPLRLRKSPEAFLLLLSGSSKSPLMTSGTAGHFRFFVENVLFMTYLKVCRASHGDVPILHELARNDAHFTLQGEINKRTEATGKERSVYGPEPVLAPFTFVISSNIHCDVRWDMVPVSLWHLRKCSFREVKYLGQSHKLLSGRPRIGIQV